MTSGRHATLRREGWRQGGDQPFGIALAGPCWGSLSTRGERGPERVPGLSIASHCAGGAVAPKGYQEEAAARTP
jgi:hypothetical protein